MADLGCSTSVSVDSVSSEQGDSSSDEEEEETEPKLQYQRLGNDVVKILKKDAASCLAVHPKVLVLGTHSGVVYILDHLGNTIRVEHLHATTINQISIDQNGDHIATCSDDCKVIILGMYNNEHNRVFMLERPILSVALDPFFFKPASNRRFIIGDDKVVLYEKTYLSRYKETVLHQGLLLQGEVARTDGLKGEGHTRNISWNGQFVAWATDLNVRVYNIVSRQVITRIKREFDVTVNRPEEHRCNMFWKDNVTLLVGWADTVEIGVIRKQLPDSVDAARKAPAEYFMEIVSIFNTPFFVNGIAPMQEMVVTLTILQKPDEQDEGKRPRLNVLEVHSEDYVEVSNDILNVKKSQEYRCNDYHLESLPEEGLYFIVSPKDVIVAKPRNEDDHVGWLLDHKYFQEALEAVENSRSLKKHSLLTVGRTYLSHLLRERLYQEAAALCNRILGKKKNLWEEEVYKFAPIQQLTVVAPYLPLGDPALDPTIYEMVLNEYLHKDTKEFVEIIRKWPSGLYSIPAVASAVLDKLTVDPSNTALLEGLSELYTYEKKYDKALEIYLRIGNKDRVFHLIHDHGLLSSVHDKLPLLMTLNKDKATNMLLENLDKVPVNLVVEKLKQKPELLYTYLSRLFQKDPEQGQDHHGLLVELFAEFEPDSLLRFLKSSNNYPLEQALDVCLQRGLVHEAVFLLGRVGSTKQALQMIMEQLGDIKEAIQFCMEHDDQELWDDLIKYSVGNPEFIRELLTNIGTHVDPIILIQQIPQGMVIPNLRKALCTILHDFNVQTSLREGCKKILVSDCYSLLKKLNTQQSRGFQITDDQVCQACNRRLLGKDARGSNDIRVFFCKHAFHEICLPTLGMDTCSICSAQKRRPGVANV